jgi:Fic family protein
VKPYLPIDYRYDRRAISETLSAFDEQVHLIGTDLLSADIYRAAFQLGVWTEAATNAQLESYDVTPRQFAEATGSGERLTTTQIRAAANNVRAIAYLNALLVPSRPEQHTPTDLSFVNGAHLVVMDRLSPPDKNGRFRDNNADLVDAQSNVVHVATSPSQIAGAMKVWADTFKETHPAHPVVRAALAHLSFEKIHPYHDGNGRVGRALISAMHLEQGLPLLPISNVISDNRTLYLEQLRQATTADATPWVAYVAHTSCKAATLGRSMARSLNREVQAMDAAMTRNVQSPRIRRSLAIHIAASPVFTRDALLNATRQSDLTVDSALEALGTKNLIKIDPTKTTLSAPNVLNIIQTTPRPTAPPISYIQPGRGI